MFKIPASNLVTGNRSAITFLWQRFCSFNLNSDKSALCLIDNNLFKDSKNFKPWNKISTPGIRCLLQILDVPFC